MTLSKLLGSRSRTLDARAPARRDSENIDNENFMKYVEWVWWSWKKERWKKGWKKGWNIYYRDRYISRTWKCRVADVSLDAMHHQS